MKVVTFSQPIHCEVCEKPLSMEPIAFAFTRRQETTCRTCNSSYEFTVPSRSRPILANLLFLVLPFGIVLLEGHGSTPERLSWIWCMLILLPGAFRRGIVPTIPEDVAEAEHACSCCGVRLKASKLDCWKGQWLCRPCYLEVRNIGSAGRQGKLPVPD